MRAQAKADAAAAAAAGAAIATAAATALVSPECSVLPPPLPLALPAPDIASLLAYRAPASAPAARLPGLPESWLAAAPSWWNSGRSLSMLATGLLAGGPWNFTLVRLGEHLFPGRSTAAIARKMMVNMSTAPIGISSTFFLTNFFQGHPHAQALERIRNDMPSTFVTGFVYWPAVSFLNLKFVEVAYRPIVGAMAGSVWNIYISAQANSKTHDEIVDEETKESAAAGAEVIVADGSLLALGKTSAR